MANEKKEAENLLDEMTNAHGMYLYYGGILNYMAQTLCDTVERTHEYQDYKEQAIIQDMILKDVSQIAFVIDDYIAKFYEQTEKIEQLLIEYENSIKEKKHNNKKA